MAKRFQKTVEDFDCERCSARVTGTGYTNHCPNCLNSKHVDVFPGDRQNTCGGLMPIVNVEMEHGSMVLIHRCERCGEQKKNKTRPEDQEAVINFMKNRGV